MNVVVISGNIGKDLEPRFSNNQMCILKFSLAVSRMVKKEGQPDTDWVNCIAFGKTAETMAKYLGKGSKIVVTGHIQTGSYTPEGADKKVFTTDIIVDRFEFADSQKEGQQQKPSDDGFDFGSGGGGGFQPVEGEDSLPF